MRIPAVLCVALFVAASACKSEDSSEAAASASAAAKKAPAKKAKKAPAEKPKVDPEIEKLPEPEPVNPVPDIPDGRSKPPSVSEWQKAEPINTQEPNSQAENCEMKLVREWLKVYCHGDVTGYSETYGLGEKQKDSFISLRKGRSVDFVFRLRRGQTQKLKVERNDAREAVLYVSWPKDEVKPLHIALGRGNKPEKKEKKKK